MSCMLMLVNGFHGYVSCRRFSKCLLGWLFTLQNFPSPVSLTNYMLLPVEQYFVLDPSQVLYCLKACPVLPDNMPVSVHVCMHLSKVLCKVLLKVLVVFLLFSYLLVA